MGRWSTRIRGGSLDERTTQRPGSESSSSPNDSDSRILQQVLRHPPQSAHKNGLVIVHHTLRLGSARNA